MPVFQTAYDTTACAGQVLSKINDALIRARVDNYIRPAEGFTDLYLVKRSRMADELVPVFHHPVVNEASGEKIVYVDVRSTGKLDARSLEFVVTNQDSFDAITLRGRLQQVWSNDGQGSLRSLKLPATVYPQWISENITRRLSLGPGEQAKICILAGILYISLFSEKRDAADVDKTSMITQVARNTNIKAAIVSELVEKFPYLDNVTDFCNAVKEELQSVRANNLNLSTLYTFMGGTWYGANAPELIAVALEHPPTWATIVYQAATARSFYHAPLAKMIAERNQFKNEIRNYVISLRESS